MSKATIKRKIESAGVTYDQAENQAIEDISAMARQGWERTSDLAVAQRKHRGSWRFVAVFTVSKIKEVGP